VAFAHFLIVGVIGFVVDAGLVFLLTSAGLSPLIARVPALAAAILTTWLLNRSITFRVAAPRSRQELVRYTTVALSSAALNFAFYAGLVAIGMWPVAAVAVSTICLLFYSFIAYRHYAFRTRSTAN
jgi:putative flippase GtrA